MLKIWSMKQQQQQAENAAATGPQKKKKVTAAQLRVQKGTIPAWLNGLCKALSFEKCTSTPASAP